MGKRKCSGGAHDKHVESKSGWKLPEAREGQEAWMHRWITQKETNIQRYKERGKEKNIPTNTRSQ